MSAQRRSATKRKQSGKRSGRSAQPVTKVSQASSTGESSSATAVTRERLPGSAATPERSSGTTVTYRPREAPEVAANDAALATSAGRATASAAVKDARKERVDRRLNASTDAEQPKRKLIDLDRIRGARGSAAPVPAAAPGSRRKGRVEAEQPKRRTLVNTDRFDGVRQFSRDTWSEIKKVNWPDRETTRNLTLVVIAVSAVLGILLGGIDFVLFQLFEALP